MGPELLDLAFSSSTIRRICKNRNSAIRSLGDDFAGFLHARLADVDAAETGLDLKLLPGIFQFNDDTGTVMAMAGSTIVLRAEQGHLATPRDSRGKVDWGEVMRLKVLDVGERK